MAGPLHGSQLLFLLVVERARQAHEQRAGEADDGVEWRAQLVADAREERGLCGAGPCQFEVLLLQLPFDPLAFGDVADRRATQHPSSVVIGLRLISTGISLRPCAERKARAPRPSRGRAARDETAAVPDVRLPESLGSSIRHPGRSARHGVAEQGIRLRIREHDASLPSVMTIASGAASSSARNRRAAATRSETSRTALMTTSPSSVRNGLRLTSTGNSLRSAACRAAPRPPRWTRHSWFSG